MPWQINLICKAINFNESNSYNVVEFAQANEASKQPAFAWGVDLTRVQQKSELAEYVQGNQAKNQPACDGRYTSCHSFKLGQIV